VLQVFLKGLAVDEQIIHKDFSAMVQASPAQLIIHHPLKLSSGIAQPEGHAVPLVESPVPPEGGFWSTVGVHGQLVEAGAEVHLRQEARARDGMKQILRKRRPVVVSQLCCVDGSVILTHAMVSPVSIRVLLRWTGGVASKTVGCRNLLYPTQLLQLWALAVHDTPLQW
jgi:hypothetical protein